MAVTLVRPVGTFVWPKVFVPQTTTVPLELSSTLNCQPQAIAIILFVAIPFGIVAAGSLVRPQAVTVLLGDNRAKAWPSPAATAITFEVGGKVATLVLVTEYV